MPARFKTGKLYTPLATTSGGTVLGASGDFNVTRATTATRVNASGLIELVASGIPRLDYFASGGTIGCPALLVEPAATNFARGVQLLNTPTPATASGGITITTGSTDFLAPDGSSGTITKYVGGTASGNIFIEYASSTSVSASGVHTFSAFVKTGATNALTFCALQFALYSAASGTAISYFNLASGTALTAGATIQNYGNGWYRIISAPYTIAAGDLAGSIRLIFAEADNDINWPASGALNLTLYAWGIQLEAGSVATSYIPTTTGSVTRNADVISVSGAVSGSIGQTEGTIYAEVDIANRFANKFVFTISSDQSTVSGRIGLNSNTNNRWRFQINDVSGTATTTSSSNDAQTLGISKVAIAYGNNQDAVLYVNGQSVITATGTSGYVFDFKNLTIGATNTNSSVWNDRIRAVALYTTRLTNAQLAALTT